MTDQHEKFKDYAIRENLKRFIMAFPELKHFPEEQAAWCMAVDSMMDELADLRQQVAKQESKMNEHEITIFSKSGDRYPDMEPILERLGNTVIRHDHESVWVDPSLVSSVVCILNDMGYETDEDILEPEISTLTNYHKILLGIATEEEKIAYTAELRQANIESATNAIEMALDFLNKHPDSVDDVKRSIRAAISTIRRNTR